MAGSFSDEFARLFKGTGFEELEKYARSFRFENCVQREGLNRIISGHTKIMGSI
jgi:hypothetical protein